MKKIIYSAGMVVFVAALAIGATGAFFSDSETSTGNTFTAGDIDLKIDNESYVTDSGGTLVASPRNSWELSDLKGQLFFSFEDVKPGDIGEDTISIHPGSNDSWVCMAADITSTPDNGINDPEEDAGDVTDGVQGGELQNFLNFTFWADDGDNVYENGETQISQLTGSSSEIFNGDWLAIADSQGDGPLPGGSTTYIGKAWCFGTLTSNGTDQDGLGTSNPIDRGTTGFTCDGTGSNNIAQTDGITVDVSFYAEQARNNKGFLCSNLTPFVGNSNLVEVRTNDLATTVQEVVDNPNKWLFYNDTNDTVMTINQFSGLSGVNDIVSGPDSVGSAQMTLDTGANPRYNIATYKYKNIKLSDINTIKYRIYDASVSPQTPFLHFNVDFNNSDTWQNRLVMVPTGVVANTWTTVDAIDSGNAMWLYSGAFWPAGGSETGATPGTTAKSWSSILADYPNAETRSTDSFFGVRVGHPGPNGEVGFVDWINFNGEVTDFEA